VAACLEPLDGESPAGGELFEATFSGVVLRSGDGLPAEACYSASGEGSVGAGLSELSDDSGYWLRIRRSDDSSEWMVGIWSPAARVELEDGDNVDIEYAHRFEAFAPDVGHLRLSSDRNGLQAIVSEGGDETQLVLPEGWTAEPGRPVCSSAESCGSWRAFDLLVGHAQAEPVELPYGATSLVSGYQTTHAGLEEATRIDQRCDDWFVANARVAVVR
jgi:hypothetical protein